jgi:hypothetical protein
MDGRIVGRFDVPSLGLIPRYPRISDFLLTSLVFGQGRALLKAA